MPGTIRSVSLLGVAALLAPHLGAQFNFDIGSMPVQIHSFGSQGFMASNENNYLTMKTSQGSFALTDGGVNISMQINDRLRIGAQAYDRNVGELGNWHPVLDWANADFKVKDWLGFRGGRVKTVLGLFNDSQDNEFLHTWALLPQSIYQLDLRGAVIAHDGGDVYGTISLKRLGHLDYTVYGGARVFDPYGGYPFSLHAALTSGSAEFSLLSETGTVRGADLRWTTPLPGLLVGASHADYGYENHGQGSPASFFPGYSSARAAKNFTNQFYFDYSWNRLRLYGEYQRYLEDYHLFAGSAANPIFIFDSPENHRSWYTAVSYRIAKRVELGTYHSRFYGEWSAPHSPDANHLFDQAVSARVDLTSHWDLKVEGHFMDGAPSFYLDGFYASVNPAGFKSKTDLLVIRTGFAF